MKNAHAKIAIPYFLKREAREVEGHLIRIEGTAMGTEHNDHLRDRIDDLFQLGFGALAFLDVCHRAVPTCDLPGSIAHRLRVKEEPPVLTVVPANPGFDPEAFARPSYDVPTVDQCRKIVWMDRHLPLALGDIEREPGVKRPAPIHKLNGSIGQAAPRDGGYRIDQLPKLIRGVSHHQPRSASPNDSTCLADQ